MTDTETARLINESFATEFASVEITKLQRALEELASPPHLELMAAIADATAICLRNGGTVFFCGNGGSAADAQHLSAELIGKQNYNRPPAAGIALTVDSSALTALGNDYGYETVFARQVQALGRPGDVLFGLSTSGRSRNVVTALAAAAERGMVTVSFTGANPADMGDSTFVLSAPGTETAKIQELHITSGHIIFALVELTLFPSDQVILEDNPQLDRPREVGAR